MCIRDSYARVVYVTKRPNGGLRTFSIYLSLQRDAPHISNIVEFTGNVIAVAADYKYSNPHCSSVRREAITNFSVNNIQSRIED